MNYGELTTAIKEYLQNEDTTFVGQIDTFILTAEDRVYRAVQMPAFFNSSAGVLTLGTSITLPSGSIEVYDVRVSETNNNVNGPWRYLLRKDWDFLIEAYPGTSLGSTTGTPKYYAISSAGVESSSGNPELSIKIAPGVLGPSTLNYVVDYYGKTAADSITNGSAAATETWLSVTFPDVLLHGSLAAAYSFMKGEQALLQHYEQQFAEGVMTMSAVVTGKGPSVGQKPG